MFLRGERGQRRVAGVLIRVRRVHAEQPQPARQGAEVYVEQEPQGRAGKPLRALDGVHLDALALLRNMRDGDLGTVHDKPADLGERDAERLDDMAERRGAIGCHG